MSPRYHISDDLLVEHAAGVPTEAVSLVVDCHLAFCADCHEITGLLDELGAVYAAAGEPVPVGRAPLAAALAQLATTERAAAVPVEPPLPAPLGRLLGVSRIDDLPWQPVVPGHWRVALDVDAGRGTVWLGRFAGGFRVPSHGHAGRELVMPLTGGFSQDGEQFAPGDIAAADQRVEHVVVVDDDGECIALVSNEVDA